MMERPASFARLQQITHGQYGHFLNHRQIFSPDGSRVYYDTRNADPEIQRTSRVESIDWRTGEIRIVYRAPHPTEYGPGVGAVVCHPHRDVLLFIHGMSHCTASKPYGMTRRFGGLIDAKSIRSHDPGAAGPEPGPMALESRYVVNACPRGGLRGGTHAHSWSRDGRWVSFTYNDDVVATRHAREGGPPDLRTVGALYLPIAPTDAEWTATARQPLHGVGVADGEEWDGLGWATVIARVTSAPRPGSDDIEQACEECWVEHRPIRTMAFLGRVRDARGNAIDEVFVAEWHSDARVRCSHGSAATDREGRLEPSLDQDGDPVRSLSVRRVTRSDGAKHPGVSGPRNWLIASPDGQAVYFPKRDDRGVVQVARAELDTGHVTAISQLSHSIENQLVLDGEGLRISAISGGVPGVLEIASGIWQPLLPASGLPGRYEGPRFSGAIHFLPDGSGWIAHGTPSDPQQSWLQLWTLTVH